MKALSKDEHIKIMLYFLADSEACILRLIDYMDNYEIRHYLGTSEHLLLNEMLHAFQRYNRSESEHESITTDTTIIKRER